MFEFLRIAVRFENFIPKASNPFRIMVAQSGSETKVFSQIRKPILKTSCPIYKSLETHKIMARG